jgi:hypothetical protein
LPQHNYASTPGELWPLPHVAAYGKNLPFGGLLSPNLRSSGNMA